MVVYLNNTCPNFTTFLYMLPVGVPIGPSRKTIPVLWITSCFDIMGRMQITSHNSNGVYMWRRTIRHDFKLSGDSDFPAVYFSPVVRCLYFRIFTLLMGAKSAILSYFVLKCMLCINENNASAYEDRCPQIPDVITECV